jgi:RNA polymerase sigma-70 factor (ECF subfamily)
VDAGGPNAIAGVDEAPLVARLRAGDEAAFADVVRRHHRTLVRLARVYVGDADTAEEVAQEAWLAAVAGLGGFEGRSKLLTWLARVTINRAKTRAVRDRRRVTDVSLEAATADDGDASRFNGLGIWRDPPRPWGDGPEGELTRKRMIETLSGALDDLPAGQRAVVVLRDVEGCDADEVCNVLEISETNQRVLLHRGRARLRSALERHLTESER